MRDGSDALLRSIGRVSARERYVIAAYASPGAYMADGADKVGALLDAVRVLDAQGARYALIAEAIRAPRRASFAENRRA